MADDPHADAEPVELISQNEALQRERSGGYLANGQRAPQVAAVDMTSPPPGGGTAPSQPAAQAAPAAPPQSDDDYWAQYEKPAKGKKAEKGPNTKAEKDPDADYWDQYGQPEAPPAKPAPAAKPQPGSLWRSAVDKSYAALQGLGGTTNAAAGAVNTIASPLIQSAQAWTQLLSGKVKSLDQAPPTEWQDAWFKHMVDPTVENAQDFALDKSATFADKAAHTFGAVMGYLSQAILTGGAGEAAPAMQPVQSGLELAGETAAHGIKAAQAPAITQAVNVGREAYQETNDPKIAFKLAAVTYSSSVEQNMLPLSMPGNLATRAGTGAVMQGVGGEAAREQTNAVAPESMKQPFSAEEMVLNLAGGAVMGGVGGPRLDRMPHQAVEHPQNIMEHAQQVAAAEVAQNGGDSLDQTAAAAMANATLSAHHDAAAYAAHMEAQHERVTQENANTDALAEQNVREDALNQAAKASAPATTPEEGFADRERTLATRRDEEFAKAKNQKGDQDIARGETLAVGAEKGEAGFEKPKLLDTLTPEQAQAFKTLKERRAAEGPQEDTKSVTERLKEQNPEDSFLPYVESPKAAKPPETLAARRKQAATEPTAVEPKAEPEAPAEGDQWVTKDGGAYEVLKANDDGSFTVRSTPSDSSQVPRRMKMSEAGLALLRARTEVESKDAAIPNTADERSGSAGRAKYENQMESNASALHQTEGPVIPGLRRQGDQSAPGVAGEPGVLSARRRLASDTEAFSGPNGQQWPLRAGERSLGAEGGSTEQSALHEADNFGRAHLADVSMGGRTQSKPRDATVSGEEGTTFGRPETRSAADSAESRSALQEVTPAAEPRDAIGRGAGEAELHSAQRPQTLAQRRAERQFKRDQQGRFADINLTADGANGKSNGRFHPEDVTHHVDGNEHTFSSPGGITMANRTPEGNLRVISSDTQNGMRGKGEGGARLERAATEAHKTGGKLESANQVSDQEQRRYKALADQGYDVKTNPHRTDPGTGEKFSTSELKPVYEVGPKDQSRARDQSPHEAPHGRDASDADRRLGPRMSQDEAAAALKPLTDKIGSEGTQIHADSTTLPDHIQQEMKDFNHPNPRAVYDPKTDTVHIVAGAHRSNDDILRTAVHEIVGHQGVRRLFDKVADYREALQSIYDNISDRAGAIGSPIKGVNKVTAKQWMKDYMAQHGLDSRNARHQELAVDEYIAHLAEHDTYDPKQENPSLLRRAIDGIRAALRKVGVVHEWTDADIRQLIRKSNNNLASENAGIRENAQWKNETGSRFADEDSREAERYDPAHPLAVAHKFGKSMEDQANYNPGFIRSRRDWAEKMGITKIDNRLALIGLRNLPDFIDGKIMPAMRQFIRTHDQMDGRRGQLMQKAADVARDWSRYISKDKVRGGALGELMHAATLGGVDPSKPFEARYSDAAKAADPTMQAHDDMRVELHKRLREVYNRTLDDKGREMFNTVRDHYTKSREDVFNALKDRIEQSGADENSKKQIMASLRQKFESGKVQGPYFPLARFGDHFAYAKDANGDTASFSRFESSSQKKAWMAEMKAKGYDVKGGERLDDKSMMERIDPKFVQKVMELTKEANPELADEIWQTYLKAMPEMSMRKQFIHRVGRLGYSMDALRAFANNSFHGAHQLARLEYGNRLDGILDNAKTQATNLNEADHSEAPWASALARELSRRYDWIKNPRSSPLASALTKFGFGWYLGAAPATAFRIFSQNPMLAAPILSKYHGMIGATRELSRASAQWAMAKGSLGDTLRGDERRAFDNAADMGVFSNTNTQMLANGGAGQPMYTGAAYHISNAAGFMFNAMEHHNRMTTYLASYRLGRTQGMSHDDAVNHAGDLTWDSHFDYTNANRPRVLQNDFAKVALLFKQYSWGVTYRLAREFRDMTNSQLPAQERRGATMALGGLLGRQMMFSGVTGLPFYWLAEKVVNAVMGDKDQPYDMTAAVHKQLADQMGQTASDAVMTGPVGAVSGASLSGGASYGDLWYREPSRDLTAPQYATDALAQFSGAVPAVALNAATGASMMHNGQIERGFEHFVPPEAASIMKAIRYSKEGVTNLRGEQVLSRDELDNRDLFLQAIGFTPQKVADAYARNTALKNVSKAITDRREQIINHLAVAGSMGDGDEINRSMDEANAFDEKNPGVAIKGGSIINATRNLLKDQAESVNGVKLPPGLGGLYDTYGKSANQ